MIGAALIFAILAGNALIILAVGIGMYLEAKGNALLQNSSKKE